MMRKLTLIILLVLSCNTVKGQIFGQDKEGFSSIIQPSSTFNLNLKDNIATLNYYRESMLSDYSSDREYRTEEECLIESKTEAQYLSLLANSWKQQEQIFKKTGLVYGIDLKGTSSDGISLLINDEQLTTSSAISGLIGFRWQKRNYNHHNIEDYAKLTYNYRTESVEEKNFIKAIESEAKKLLSQEAITKGKMQELLFFIGTKEIKSKIESIEDRIEGVTKSKGFVDPVKVEQNLTNRLNTLALMQTQIVAIKLDIVNYQAKVTSGTSNAIYQALDVLKNRIATFETNLKSKLIKPLGLKLDYKEYKNASKWSTVNGILDEAIETVGFNLYKHKMRVVAPVSNTDIIKAYQNYLNYLKKDKLSLEKVNVAKGETYSLQRRLIYFKGGFLGSSFKYDTAKDSSSISDRFITQNFQGYQIELGYTSQLKRYNFLGFNVAMSRTSNINRLTPTTYKFQQEDTSVTPNIITESELKALSGPFDRFLRFGLSFDYVRLFPFHDSNASEEEIKKSKTLLSLNPYVRHYFYDRSETLKPHTSLGVGIYSFNKTSGSIAGGLFIQTDDVFNVNRSKAINFAKQISFGIVFKVNIKSFDPSS
ncbi:hypothetical protein [Changchengzhania lutea]|uniref:hypothetical protein n=1 Tax=Changchengzhania lutea TaxID=2049305 RepID=UPI00115C8237|nr:hypothetical protein [Changchengzhania lutea]